MPSPYSYPIQSFLETLKFEKRYSIHTLRAYEDDLIQFFDYLATVFDTVTLEDITSPMVRSWLASLRDNGLTAKSINRKSSSLKSFFKHQLVQGTLDKTPMTTVRSPRIPKRLPVYVQQAEMEVVAHMPESFEGTTHILLIELLYVTGMRLSELINLKETDVDASHKVLKVFGKGKKERLIPVSELLVSHIQTYIQEKAREIADCDRNYLLVNVRGKKLYEKYVYRAVHKYLSQITTLSKKSPHVLRHSFATHLTNNGAELNAVKELLGHSSLAATQIYTHNSIEKLKEIHSRSHPKS